jgi:uncharacterized GH25 family protein
LEILVITKNPRKRCATIALPVAVAALIAAASATLGAHDFWIEPTAFRPTLGALVGLRLMVGQDLLGDPVPRDPAAIERFTFYQVARDRGIEQPVPGREGGDPAGIFRVDARGLLIVAYHSRPHAIELTADKFEQYLGDEGLDAVKSLKAGSPARRIAHELYSRCAKALLWSGTAGAADRDRPIGLPLELVAERNPYVSASGEDFSFTLLYEGKPQPDALVVAINREFPSMKLTARSDRQGRITFRLMRSGSWLIKAVHMIPAKPETGADWESFWASITFDLAAPGAVPTAARR